MKTTTVRGKQVLSDEKTGYAKTYTNRTQAERRVALLCSAGISADVYRWGRPFFVVIKAVA